MTVEADNGYINAHRWDAGDARSRTSLIAGTALLASAASKNHLYQIFWVLPN